MATKAAAEEINPTISDRIIRPPVVLPGQTLETVTERISNVVLVRPVSYGWMFGFGVSFMLLMLFFFAVSYLLVRGVGIWGVDIPVAWGFAIANFVWWIGIGHAGTLISAILLLMNQQWRTSINRFAEAMTLFAVACAGMFPLLHLGRPYYFYWLLPYPNIMQLWPQFRSPLVWDVFAVSTYATVSLLFWFLGLVPDLATMRDRARNKYTWVFFGILALGWRGASRHWYQYERVYLLLAGLATPLVVSVHTVVSFDFAVAQVPGWHSTIFPPYFVAGAVFSGFAMVITLTIPIRAAFDLGAFITRRHLENMAKILLATCLMVAYSYIFETFFAWYSGNPYEAHVTVDRATGAYAWLFWLQIFCNVVAPQILWFRRFRANVPLLFVLSIIVNIGMWTERYVIVVSSLHRDFLPSSWGMYSGTIWDYATLLGSLGLFFSLMFLFVRLLPAISMAEMRELVSEKAKEEQN